MSTLSTYSTKELQQKAKKQKTIVFIQAFVLLLMVILAVYATLDQGITFLTFLPLFFIPMEILMIYELQKINKELKSRNAL